MGYFNKSRGYALEHRVKQAFEKAGFNARRNEFSATPDVIVFDKNKIILGLECKNRTQKEDKPIYISKKQMEILYSFCSKYGIMPYIVFSFYRKSPKVISPGLLKKTRTGQYVIEKELDSTSETIDLKDFIEGFKKE